ncbi:MAG: carbamoyltransferase HypF [Gemmatimonadota bacterium]|nr:carbamoyltransferase HypF [Gemmatimonadota bacterium]
MTLAGARRRVRARIGGTVQGVGFRPYVFKLAARLELSGFVLNDERGVLVEVEGEGAIIDRFLECLPAEAPPLATVEGVWREEVAPTGELGFRIVASAGGGETSALVAPDSATCADCLTELFDPANRRFRYPFINCTNCGPRFTIVLGVPYDRHRTTMAGFQMCPRCRAEYDDPADRRFHAQPNACAECGPAVRLTDASGASADAAGARDAIEAAARGLRDGAIVAIKGLGGFHLACRAGDERAVATLRARKYREAKPFALMVDSIDAARELVEVGQLEEALLTGRERPIVLCLRRAGAPVAPEVAPRSRELGVMLPYSPLHHLLLGDAAVPLVMTSGNLSDEPIAYQDADGVYRLAGVADLFLQHDRPIQTRTDDSVLRVVTVGGKQRALPLRRSRGYVPEGLELPVEAPPLLACGAELKSTFCLAKGRRAWIGHHIGDLKNYETLCAYREGIGHFERLFAVEPEVVAHDLHPDYLSTAYALERAGVELVAVQHHHAHLAACLAEHGEAGPAVGAIFDGSGFGPDGTVWGGELLYGGLGGFERAGHLWPVTMPGGDRAVLEPWRMACAWLVEAKGTEPELPPTLTGAVEPRRWSQVARLAGGGIAAPVTTSAGRLFDAVAALCGICPRVEYEGQAAIELEALAAPEERGCYPLDVCTEARPGAVVLDARDTVLAAARDASAGISAATISARFHRAVAAATAQACELVARRHGVALVVLSGGVFQNRRLLEDTAARLSRAGLRVLIPERLPPNDGGIAYGQAAIAAWGRAHVRPG